MLDSAPALCVPTVVGKRFLTFPSTVQQAILRQLRWAVFPEGIFSQVPPDEWLRLLRLTDPLIHYTDAQAEAARTYQVRDGRQVLLLLLRHYLDVH
jgi:hypothetical protein